MADDKNLQGVYNTLKREGYTPPEYDRFVKDMEDDNNLRGVYNTLRNEGYTPPEYEQFRTDMLGGRTSPTVQPLLDAAAAVERAVIDGNGNGSSKEQGAGLRTTDAPGAPVSGSEPRHAVDSAGEDEELRARMALGGLDVNKPEDIARQLWRDVNGGAEADKARSGNNESGGFRFVDNSGRKVKLAEPADGDWWVDFLGEMKRQGVDINDRRAVAGYMEREAARRYSGEMEEAVESSAYSDRSAISGGTGMEVTFKHLNAPGESAGTAFESLSPGARDYLLRQQKAYLRENPAEATGSDLDEAAQNRLKEILHERMRVKAYEEMKKSAREEVGFMDQVTDSNLMYQLDKALEGSAADRYDDPELQELHESAKAEVKQEWAAAHPWLNVLAVPAGMAIDPVTWLSGGAGSAAAKGMTTLGGKMILGRGVNSAVASRYFGSGLGGRIFMGSAHGAGFMGSYEAMAEGVNQAREGEFSPTDIMSSAAHGVVIGAVSGAVTPMWGNACGRARSAVDNAAGKVGGRAARGAARKAAVAKAAINAGETAGSVALNGTVFGAEHMYEIASMSDEEFESIYGEGSSRGRAMFDAWSDAALLDMGFKTVHGIKSAPGRLREMGAELHAAHARGMSFGDMVRQHLKSGPRGLRFSDEDLAELRRAGYGSLSHVFEHKDYRMPVEKGNEVGQVETVSPIEGFDGFEVAARLMGDRRVPAEVRAKVYTVITGHQLPAPTIMGYRTDEYRGEGSEETPASWVVESYGVDGQVITRRRYTNEVQVRRAESDMDHQLALNAIDVGEKAMRARAFEQTLEAAIGTEMGRVDAQTVRNLYARVKAGDADVTAGEREMAARLDAAMERLAAEVDVRYPEDVRREINGEFSCDMEKILSKDAEELTAQEMEARDEYARRLFPEPAEAAGGEPGEAAGWQRQIAGSARAAQEEAMDNYLRGRQAAMRHSESTGAGERGEATAELETIASDYKEALETFEEVFASEAEVRRFQTDENPFGVLFDPELTEDQRDAVMGYMNAKSALEGAANGADDTYGYRCGAVREAVRDRTHRDARLIIPATMKVGDRQVYVIKGDVVMFGDGTGVDERNSSRDIYIMDAQSGKVECTSPHSIARVEAGRDPQAELDSSLAALREEREELGAISEYLAPTQSGQQSGHNSATERKHDEPAAASPATAGKARESALSLIPVDEATGEPRFEAADKETAWEGLVEAAGGNVDNAVEIARAQIRQATEALEALKKKPPTVKAPQLKGSPMAMARAQADAQAAREQAMERYDGQIAALQTRLDAWSSILGVNSSRMAQARRKATEERAALDALAHDEAVARFEDEQRDRAMQRAEREAVGAHAVNLKIKARWDSAPKLEGDHDAITLPDGSSIRGRYVLTEAGAASASHDVNKAYAPTEGFPVDENGQSVNDRDYLRDKDAQRIVEQMAEAYDNRALQTPVIVSEDGVVLSGNNRTMSGDLAARQGTDKAYVDYLREFGQKYGFTPEQVAGMKNPRLVFVPDEAMPYDATTFSRFNAQEMKSQSKPEAAVRLGKIVPDNVFNDIVGDIARHDRLSDYYADEKAVAKALGALMQSGVINDRQMPEMRTGTALSAAGKELIENTLIGKVFQASPDAVRRIISMPALRQAIVTGLNEIAGNRTLANSGYDLSEELANAVDLVFRAKSAMPDVYTEGMPVSPFGRMQGLFDDEFGDSRVTDGATLLLADVLNSGRPGDLRKLLTTYNNEATESAAGQIDMFSGSVPTKEDILTTINGHFRNATPGEQQALVDAAIAQRKARAKAEAEQRGRDQAGEQAENAVQRGAEPQQPASGTTAESVSHIEGNGVVGRSLTAEEATKLIGKMENAAEIVNNIELTPENWIAQFGEEGKVTTPIGEVKMGENQFMKLFSRKRTEYFGMIKPTLTNPDVVLEEIDPKEGAERDSKYLFIKTFVKPDGSRIVHFESVTVRKDGMEVSISSHEIKDTAIKNKMQNDKILHLDKKLSPDSEGRLTETPNETEGPDLVPTSDNNIVKTEKSIGKTTDTDENPSDLRGDTVLSQDSNVSDGKVNTLSADKQASSSEISSKPNKLFDYFTGSLSELIVKAKESAAGLIKKIIAPISERLRSDLSAEGIEIDEGYKHVIDNNAIRHTLKNHSGKSEEKRGQIPITDEDFSRLEDVVTNYDNITVEKGKRGNDNIIYSKTYEDGTTIFVEENRVGRKELAAVTMWKKKIPTRTDANHTEATQISDLGGLSDGKVNTLSADKQASAPESSAPYTITSATYTNKKGKETPMFRVTFSNDLTKEQESALKAFASEKQGEGRFAPARGWKDREKGGWLFRTAEDARRAGELTGNDEAVADAQPMTAAELREAIVAISDKPIAPEDRTRKKPKESPINRVSLEDVASDLQSKGEAKLSDHAGPVKAAPEKQHEISQGAISASPQQSSEKSDSALGSHEISDDEMQSLANDLRGLLGIGDDEGDAGIRFRDPGELTPQERQRLQSAGIRLAMGLVERGTSSFPDYAAKMVGLLGNKIRPWLKSFYEGARWTPGYENYTFTPSEEVARFDVHNFDKAQYDPIAQAAMIVEERKASTASKQAQKELTEIRNNNRKKQDEQTTADTAALAVKAEAIASEAESLAETAEDRGQLNRASEAIDETLDEINDRLALLGYYEAVVDDAKFHESYGYMLTAEKRAVEDAAKLAKQLVNDLGIDLTVTSATTPLGSKSVKKGTAVRANIAPAGGDVTITLPLNDGRELAIYIGLTPVAWRGARKRGDNLAVERILYRVENPAGQGMERYGHNMYAPVESTYSDFLHRVKEITHDYLPQAQEKSAEERYRNRHEISGTEKPKDIFEEAAQVAEKAKAKRISRKKETIVNPEEPMGDLFGGLFADENINTNKEQSGHKADESDEPISDEKKTDIRPRSGTPGREGGYEPQPNEPLGKSQRNETERTDGGGVGGRDRDNPISDEKRGGGVSKRPKGAEPLAPLPEAERKNVRNNHAERGVDYAPKGEDARIKANIEAIELARQLIESGESATPEQMKILRRFSGWGGLGKAFNDKGENPTVNRLHELLGEDGYNDAVMSRNSAYFTPAPVIDAMWDVARALGFKGGKVLEGSAGIGNILGLMPRELSDRSEIHAVEIDRTTGSILSLLYPDAKVDIQGFEKTRIRNNSVDLAITNVPFVTDLHVMDETGDKDLSKKFRDIHDFCIAKNIRKLREGGIGIFITSSGTMDNSARLRAWITGEGNADVVGAFRMHNKTFGGTPATSDIIVVRKRVNGKVSPNAIDVTDVTGVRVAEYDTGDTRKVKGEEVPIIKRMAMEYNKYFAEHPENMAGEMMFNFERGVTFHPTSRSLFPVEGKEQTAMLKAWADRFADMVDEDAPAESAVDTHINEQLGKGVKEGSMVLNSQGGLCMARMGEAVPLGLNKNKVKGHTKAECFKAYTAIKEALADVLDYQSSHEDNAGLEPLLKELNRVFDAFTRTYGNLHKNTAIAFLRNDVDFSSILALESYSEKGDKKGNKVVKVGKTDIFRRRVIDTEKEPRPKTVKDGILASLYKTGGIDAGYIAQALGKSVDEVKGEIVESGLGYENPANGMMEVSYQYLSGNVREKLHIAQENNEDGRYDVNITALQRSLPMTIPAHLIEFSIGSSWIDPKLYEAYVKEKTGLDVRLTNAGGTWIMTTPFNTYNEKNRAMAVVSKMCDKTIMGHELIESAMTNRSITVSKTERHSDGSTETITDKEATAACGAKVDEIRSGFKDWARDRMQSDPEMSALIETTYNERFNNYVPMRIPDEFVPKHFGGQVSELHGKPFALRPHQGKAVVRGTTEPVMLAHEVGTGKTFTLITTAMEMRRLGTARKPMIVVQNATVGQFVESAKEIYPNAKVLTIEEADRTADGRRNFYAKIKYNDWDMIVVPQSVFERIPDSAERQMAYVKDFIEEKMQALEAMRAADDSGRSPIVRQAERELEDLQDQLANLTEILQNKNEGREEEARATGKKRDGKREAKNKQNAEVKAKERLDRTVDDVENFDDMGIDAILVDEAHEYKHLGFATAMQRGVKGIDPSYSKKALGVYLKAQAVMERNNGRNVVFATGTPISNTAAEIWTFMRYLMPADRMKEYGIYYFDDFVRNFGNLSQMVEFKTNGKFDEVNRFAGYVNLPELVRIWSSVADTVQTREAGGVSDKIPDMEGGKAQDIYLPQTKALRSVMKYVKAQLDAFEQMEGREKRENSHIPLTMYGIAKAAAVDARLVLADAEDDPNSKTNAAVRETLRSLEDSKRYKGTVAIFADNYQNKRSGFNLYEDIRRKLTAAGVPQEQIAIIKSGMTVKKKLDIFEKVNAGEIRVIMGSTFTLGTGVNIQERLHTAIHVDAPNRPMDYTQRNGRILRQGNLHKDMGTPVRVLRFGVEDSLDVTAYQRLKTKGAIADSIMNGSKMMQNSMENRVLEEDEDVFGDMTAQLSGSQYAILKNQAEREVRNLTSKQKQHEIDQIHLHNSIPTERGFIAGAERRIAIETANIATIGKHFPEGKITKVTIGKLTFDSPEAMEDFFKEQNTKKKEASENVERTGNAYRSRLTINVNGLDFVVTTDIDRVVTNNGQMTLDTSTAMTLTCEALQLKENVPYMRVKEAMKIIADDIATGSKSRKLLSDAQYSLSLHTEQLWQMEARYGKEFPYTKELEAARQRLEEYTEKMREEVVEKEKKYAEMDKGVEAAANVELTDEAEEEPTTTGDKTRFRVIDEGEDELLSFLNSQPLKKGYRYAQWADMGVRPPMTAKVNGEWRPPMLFSRWEQSEEGMRKANGKADLVQGNGRTTGDVAYNPYFHIRTSPLNDQFTAAYDRPELIVVEGYYPESEETSDYRADGAKDSVGLMDWHSGSVNGQLSDETKVQTMLSRYFKPSRIVPWDEVAELIMERVGDQQITFPINAVPPMLRAELARRGAKFSGISGSVAEADIPMLEDLRKRVNAGEWDAGLESAREYMDAYESTPEAKEARVEALSKDLHTPIRVIRDQSEVDALLTPRERRAKGWWSSEDNGVVVVLPNNVNVADVDNTVVHEVVGHKGLRALIGEKRFDEFLGEVYGHAGNPIRRVIDKKTDEMVAAETDRLRVRKSVAHERAGEDVNAHYYTDMAKARVEAEKKREQFRKEATEEYMADLGGRIGSEGFEKMSRDELTLWGRIKAKVQQFLDKFLKSLKIARNICLNDKDLSYILYKSWKNMRHPKTNVFVEAEDAVRRQGTRFSEPRDSEFKKVRKEAVADRIEELFDQAISGELKGKPVEVGRLTEAGRKFLEQLSGKQMKEEISFVVNPSDLLHIHHRHFGNNEKDGRNIPLTKEDIRNIHEILCNPDNVIFGVEQEGQKRAMFFFLKEAKDGSYNLMEVYADKKGNLTSKSFFKSKEGVTQRAMLLKESSALTSVTDGATLISGAKLPKFFEYPKLEGEEDVIRFRDPGLGLEETISKMKAEAMQANAGNLQTKREAMRAIGGNLNHLRRAMARQREYDITTVKSVSDLARVLMDAGLLDDLSKFETKRILGAIGNVVGRQDVSQYVQKVMDIMVDNQLRLGANTFGRLLSIRGNRVDARGIEVQGELDPEGQLLAQVVRKSTSLSKDDIDNRIADAIDRMSSSDHTIADEATIEYAGLQIARQYVEDITESKAEEKDLRDSIKRAKEDKDAGQMSEVAYKQYVEATNDAIRQNKIERAEAFYSLVEQVGDVLSGSIEKAKAWREAEKQRVEEIHHNANSDMEGRPTDEHHKDDRIQKVMNNSFARFLLAPLATFDQMLRMFGKKNTRGEGYLWNRYMRGWVEATEKEYTGYREALKVLDRKVSEVFGKKMTWGDLFAIDRKLPNANVSFWDGGAMKDHALTQGNLLYIYMADKMSDGRMKLRRMGVTENDIENIKNFLDPRFIELADWMQEEFLVDKRNEYNEVHKRMFGASMAAIENYFPLKILANARLENVDVADDTADTALPATSTGSIIKRRRNNLALDVTGANAFSVILDHLQQMERWAAFAEFNRDLNTLLSYKRFRNQVMNMSSVYGAGKTLWNNFRNVCSMAAGAYRPPIAALDKSAVNIAKGVTAAKVSFRLFTALKQLLSMPAYISDSNPMYLAANLANPIGAWKWSMKNLPLFEKRWKSRMAGDPRLLKTDMDWKMWRSRVVEIASRVGMSPNAFVDALTVAIGTHAMYQTKLAKYMRQGYDPDVAEARAKQDATILFNQTQQSSEGAFLSTMQVDRSWLSVLFTVFRNSSMSYTRQLYDAIRNISHRLTPGYKGLTEEFMAKQMKRDGIDPDQADRNAKREYRRGIVRDLVRVAIFGYGLQLLWNMGNYALYLILGDNDEEKDKMMNDVFNHTMFGSIEGLTGGDVMSAAGNMWLSGEGNPAYLTKDMPLASDVLSILKKMDEDKIAAMNDVINLFVQSGLGVNPQSLTDAVVAVMDLCGDDAETSRECALLISRVLNCPQSQIDKIYFDELDASAREASMMTPMEIAERYARYKVRRGAPLTGWAYGNEQREKLMEKYRNRSNTLAKERLNRATDNAASANMADILGEYEQTKKRVSEINKVKSRDEDSYYELLDELEATPEFIRYQIVKDYKRDVDALTKEWLRAKTSAERDSCAQAILALKAEMAKEIEATQ